MIETHESDADAYIEIYDVPNMIRFESSSQAKLIRKNSLFQE